MPEKKEVAKYIWNEPEQKIMIYNSALSNVSPHYKDLSLNDTEQLISDANASVKDE